MLAKLLADRPETVPAAARGLRTGQSDCVLARAQQDAVWDQTQAHNRLRSHLREYYPAIPEAFAGKRERLLAREARAVLAIAATLAAAVRPTHNRLKSAIKCSGRRRRIEAEAGRLLAVFHQAQLHQPPLVEEAMRRQTLALLPQLDAARRACEDLARDTEELFLQHPDAEIIASFPGLAGLTGARILAEIGDNRTRFESGRDLKAYAGSAPVTRESGKSRRVSHRRIKNSHLAATGRNWAFSALTASPGAHAHCNRRRDIGDHLSRRPSPLVQPHARPAPPLLGNPPEVRRNSRLVRTRPAPVHKGRLTQ
ncbi:transposase [Streptomyces sp. NPDC001185]|uniref:transposase n=1 Tax=Streptomyces sp. NPDC001185 TaxID=3154380 RepID=UPI003325ADB0